VSDIKSSIVSFSPAASRLAFMPVRIFLRSPKTTPPESLPAILFSQQVIDPPPVRIPHHAECLESSVVTSTNQPGYRAPRCPKPGPPRHHRRPFLVLSILFPGHCAAESLISSCPYRRRLTSPASSIKSPSPSNLEAYSEKYLTVWRIMDPKRLVCHDRLGETPPG
jgi:hypothetical protein